MDESGKHVKVLSIGWLGVRTDSSDAMSAFLRDELELAPIQDGGTGSFPAPDGNVYEIIGPDDLGA